MATIRTLVAKTTKRRSQNQNGFTLIEIMVVVAIIAFVAVMAVPRLGKTLGTQLSTSTRNMVILSKELHHFARLRNKTYRMVIGFGDLTHKASVWVESASEEVLLAPADATPTPEPRNGDKTPQKGTFGKDGEVLHKPIEFPDGVNFEDVQYDSKAKPITQGAAYIHYFPEGLVQQTVIHLGDGKNIHWTLIINPLTGYTDILKERREYKDIYP